MSKMVGNINAYFRRVKHDTIAACLQGKVEQVYTALKLDKKVKNMKFPFWGSFMSKMVIVT